MVIKIIVNSRGVENKLKKLQQELSPRMAKDTFAAAEYARNVARNLVPIDTKETHDAIAVIVKTNTRHNATAVLGFRGFVHRDKRWKGKYFNLPYWMTMSPNAITHPWHNGDPKFLLIAKELAFEKFKKDVRIDLKNLVN